MTKQPADRQLATLQADGWLSLKAAAKLCQSTPADFQDRIRTGQLHAFTIERGGKVRFRVSRAALINAGLLGRISPPQPAAATVDLLTLIRDQNQRIDALEDQRAQLAGQLGVALERLRAIDQRLTSLESAPETEMPADTLISETVGSRSHDVVLRSIFRSLPIPGTGRWKREAN